MYTIDGGNTFTRIPNANLPRTLPNEVFIIYAFKTLQIKSVKKSE